MLHDENLVHPDLHCLSLHRRHVCPQWEAERTILGGKRQNSLSCLLYVCKGLEKRAVFQRGIRPILGGTIGPAIITPGMEPIFLFSCGASFPPLKAVLRHLPVECKHAKKLRYGYITAIRIAESIDNVAYLDCHGYSLIIRSGDEKTNHESEH